MDNAPMTQEQIDYFAMLQERSTRKAVTRAMKRAFIGYAILLVGVLAFSLLTSNAIRDNAVASNARLRAGLVSSCERVNILRAQSNISDAVVFNILSASGRREAKLAKTDNPSTRETHAASAKIVFDSAGALTITQLTDCNQAVDNAEVYDFPIAGPIGDPKTGKLSSNVQAILDSSKGLVRQDGA